MVADPGIFSAVSRFVVAVRKNSIAASSSVGEFDTSTTT